MLIQATLFMPAFNLERCSDNLTLNGLVFSFTAERPHGLPTRPTH